MTVKYEYYQYLMFFQETRADYVATDVFVEEVVQLFDSFDSVKHAPPPLPQERNCLAHLAMTVVIWDTGSRQIW
jgi:predicted phosphoadenosine phosphosulfate sulfurtransferase